MRFSGLLEIGWKVPDSNCLIELHEVGRGTREAVVGDHDTLVVAIQCIESFGNQLEFVMWSHIETACKSKISCGVIGSEECVAAVSGNAVIGIVVILIGISGDAGIDGAATADGENSGKFPVVEELGQECVIASEGLRLVNRREHEAMAHARKRARTPEAEDVLIPITDKQYFFLAGPL